MQWRSVERTLNVVVSIAIILIAVELVNRRLDAKGLDSRGGIPERIASWRPSSDAGYRFGSSGPVELVVIEDPQCPVCASFSAVLDRLPERTASQIQVTRVLIPLSYHRHAGTAIHLVECAETIGRSEQVLHAIYEKQDSLGLISWSQLASIAGLPRPEEFAQCAVDTVSSKRDLAARAFADTVRIEGTPTVIINGWKLPHPPGRALLQHLVDSIAAGRHPFKGRAWLALRDATRGG